MKWCQSVLDFPIEHTISRLRKVKTTSKMEEVELGEEGIILDGVRVPPAPPTRSDCVTGELIITEMICENFKSYAGIQSLGPFHPRFNAVIGPNGSGKSNVIDAMLFVFGYRASKIRSKKISVLIHNSSEHPGMDFCSVTVVFLNPKDGEKLRVKRTAFKDNSSFYEVEGKKKKSHLKKLLFSYEPKELIWITIASVEGGSDTGMLEFLEDIIGSSRLKEPIEIFKERSSELDEARNEKLNRVKLVEKEKKDDLEGPKDEAIDYLRKENKIIVLKNQEFQVKEHQCEVRLEAHKTKKEKFMESSKDVLDKIESISKERAEAETKLNTLAKQKETVNCQLEEFKEKFKNHELEDSKLLEEMKLINIKRKKIITQSKTEKEKYEKLLKVPDENKQQIEECTEQKEKIAKTVEIQQGKYDEAVQSIKAETQEIQDKKETHETKLIDLKKIANDKSSKVAVAKSELELEESNEKKERGKLEGIPEMKNTLDTVQKEVRQLSDKVEKYQDKVKSSRILYEETKSNYQATKSRGRVHGSLMEQKANGRIPGIFGRLGDLGAIDQKFDVAVSTAGGSALDTIIVDNVETGKACINFLKKNDIGRANFLALDKTDRWKPHCGDGFRAPEQVHRLFDLIQVADNKLKPAFYHYLRDTLVANEMAQAQRIAFGRERYRVVTLDGEVIEKSGAMSGGGREKARGKIGSQVAATSVGGSSNSELEKKQYDLEKNIATCEDSQERWKLEKERLEQEIKLLKSKITEQTKVVNELITDEKKLSELRSELESLEEDSETATNNAKQVEDIVNKLNKQIKEIMGSKVKTVQKKLEEAKLTHEKLKKEITRLEVGIKSSDRDIEKSKDKFTSLDTEVTECEEKMRNMKTQRESLEEVGKELLEVAEKLKVERQEKTTEYEDRKKEFEYIKEDERRFKSSRIEIDEKLSFYESSIKEETRNIALFKRDCKKLALIDVPGDDKAELEEYDAETLDGMDLKDIQYKKVVIAENIAKIKPNLAVIAEFTTKESLYLERIAELEDLTSKRDKQKKNYDDIRKMRLNEFMEGFSIITSKLKEMYQMITLGGDAELELVDSLDPFTEGIVFSVRPPKKSWKNISNLSGGEKTLSSLALVFALHYYKPTPLYVMDEIDAALDFKNVSIIANYIKERTKDVQFIIISLRSNMFELAERLVGIYKTQNATKSIALDPSHFVSASKSINTTGHSTTAMSKASSVSSNMTNVLQTPVKNSHIVRKIVCRYPQLHNGYFHGIKIWMYILLHHFEACCLLCHLRQYCWRYHLLPLGDIEPMGGDTLSQRAHLVNSGYQQFPKRKDAKNQDEDNDQKINILVNSSKVLLE
ncbi:Chromosome condensation protein dpy-27,Structural maintenance of chromosomes protein 4 [Lepeophtheirus salmonis]|uniref:Structural maintenance of chromosomes protein n=1 Tax=Lepeophtheirus salmonis TaxID=72036 RepID=A0A7R8HAD4_LEPSM|nr:Chromosome condensation protein dpy-27,Structural maintenance of chromosomes protein 4 [Lepeophtheirus salmonis]CAF2970158.1 Chromosome condensation protein dpy-27,Structural maintenance of chromosomes protein 4 [Lepeophtheirus salmonis]